MSPKVVENNGEKLNKFHLAINNYAEEQRKRIEDEVEQFKQKELDEAEVEVLSESYRLIQKEMDQMRSGISREMAQRGINERRALLAKRQQITEEVFNRAKKSLLAFASASGYTGWLCARAKDISSAFSAPGTVLNVRKEDVSMAKELAAAFGAGCISVEEDADITLGGVRAVNASLGILADETLDSLLENQRDWFEEYSGMTVV